MGRRANGEGTIYQLPDGRWRVTVSVCHAGKLARRSKIRPRRSDCVAILPELRSELGIISSGGTDLTLQAYLEQWLGISGQHLEPQTVADYRRMCKKHIYPRLGSARLSRLLPIHCEQFKAAMIKDGVGPRAAQSAFQILRTALKAAVYPLRMIRSNPCDGIKTPRHTKREMRPFEAAEAKKIMDSARDTRWHAFYAVAFGTGLRGGELLGLRWTNIDTKAAKLTVTHQAITRAKNPRLAKPKTKKSQRTIDLPPLVVNALRDHRALQMKNGLAGCDLVFPTQTGKILCYSNFYKDEWQPRLTACGLEARGFHNSRHTFATLSLLAGVPAPVVSKALGHANTSITMGVYSHCLPSSENAAAVAMEQLLG